ncbi:Thermostable beta-glucosidase B [compost metagenome]
MKKLLFFSTLCILLTEHLQAQKKTSSSSYEKTVNDLISKMTLAEKVHILHGDHLYSFPGIERLGIPAFFPSDGPCSVRPELSDDGQYVNTNNTKDCATALPTLSAVAATWDTEICYLFGSTLSSEVRARGKDMTLGPGVNIMRTPLCGRTFEYMGEDPFLTSKLCVPLIKGIQSNDVGACVKHFAMNNQELNRFEVNAKVDERTMREIYLPSFEAAVKQGDTWSLMGAYNKVNGDWCCENPYLLKTILREEWGFDGLVISDWGAIHDYKKAALAGCDLESDRGSNYIKLEKAIINKELPESVVDEKVRRLLTYFCKIKKIGPDAASREKGSINTNEHQLAAKKIAAESIVLLKNSDNVLPLDKTSLKKILVIGRNADLKLCVGIATSGRCDLALAGGSGEAKPLYEITALQGLKNALGTNTEIQFINAKEYSSEKALCSASKNFCNSEFIQKVKSADAVLLFTGNSHVEEQEGSDRLTLNLPTGQDEMVNALAGINPKTVVINQSGAPVAMPWIAKTNTVVQYWFSGQEGGNALADVLFGTVNPSGKLPCTFPQKLEDVACHANKSYVDNEENYSEGVLVGYRWFDSKNIQPLFPFGHGLSYTQFEYGKPTMKKEMKSNDILVVKIPVTNTGNREGAEVVQLYIHETNPVLLRPEQELKGFSKVSLKPGETKIVEIQLSARDFSYWSVEEKGWKASEGKFEIRVGSSSRDIRAKEEVKFVSVKKK